MWVAQSAHYVKERLVRNDVIGSCVAFKRCNASMYNDRRLACIPPVEVECHQPFHGTQTSITTFDPPPISESMI